MKQIEPSIVGNDDPNGYEYAVVEKSKVPTTFKGRVGLVDGEQKQMNADEYGKLMLKWEGAGLAAAGSEADETKADSDDDGDANGDDLTNQVRAALKGKGGGSKPSNSKDVRSFMTDNIMKS